MSERLNTVTGLVLELVDRIQSTKTTREQTEEQANEVLKNEQDRLDLIKEYELEVHEEKHEEEDENNESVSQDYAENIQLKMELQKLQEANDKCSNLVYRFTNQMANLTNDTQRWVRDYQSFVVNVENCYNVTLNDEKQFYNECQNKRENMLSSLKTFHSNLVNARDKLPEQSS